MTGRKPADGNPQSLVIGKKTRDRLNDDEKALIKDAAAKAQVYQREVTANGMGTARGYLEQKAAVNDLSVAEKERFRQRV